MRSLRTIRSRQRGYMLMVLIFMMALMLLAITAAAPRVAQQTKRDREIEMIHRGAQYSRAIKRFYRKFGRYPNTVEQLENTNNLRFLRKKYADPMTEDGKWKFLHPGDVKIGGSNVGTPVSSLASGTQQPTGLSNPSSTSTSPGGRPRSTTTTGGSQNSQFGGFIIGVASLSEREGIHEFDKKSHYNEWYFLYDPTTDRGNLITGPYDGKTFGNANQIPGATPAGQQPGGFGQPISPGGIGRPGGGFGQPIGGTGPGAPPTPPKQ